MLPELSKYEVENSWQRAYLDSFIEKGWPSSKNEEWKFTSLSDLFEKVDMLDKSSVAIKRVGGLKREHASIALIHKMFM